MKTISVHVTDDDYQELKSIAARHRRPVAALIREAMTRYLQSEKPRAASVLDLPAHDSGRALAGWTRSELLDEMLRP